MELDVRRLEILNQVGEALADSFGASRGWPHVLACLRAKLDLSGASVWSVVRGGGVVKNAAAWADAASEADHAALDERLTKGQSREPRPYFASPGDNGPAALPFGAASLPLMVGGPLRGVLNIVPASDLFWRLSDLNEPSGAQFLRALTGQLAIFLERRELEVGAARIQEIHHRVKNNLNTVASLLRMQARRLGDPTARQALEDSVSQVISIAAAHDALSRASAGYVGLGDLLRGVCAAVTGGLDSRIVSQVEDRAPELALTGAQASVVALIVNELVQNAAKYARHDRESCAVLVETAWLDGRIAVAVQDDGPGFPEPPRRGLGLELVEILTHEELRGEIAYENRSGGRVTISFMPLTLSEWSE